MLGIGRDRPRLGRGDVCGIPGGLVGLGSPNAGIPPSTQVPRSRCLLSLQQTPTGSFHRVDSLIYLFIYSFSKYFAGDVLGPWDTAKQLVP